MIYLFSDDKWTDDLVAGQNTEEIVVWRAEVKACFWKREGLGAWGHPDSKFTKKCCFLKKFKNKKMCL